MPARQQEHTRQPNLWRAGPRRTTRRHCRAVHAVLSAMNLMRPVYCKGQPCGHACMAATKRPCCIACDVRCGALAGACAARSPSWCGFARRRRMRMGAEHRMQQSQCRFRCTMQPGGGAAHPDAGAAPLRPAPQLPSGARRQQARARGFAARRHRPCARAAAPRRRRAPSRRPGPQRCSRRCADSRRAARGSGRGRPRRRRGRAWGQQPRVARLLRRRPRAGRGRGGCAWGAAGAALRGRGLCACGPAAAVAMAALPHRRALADAAPLRKRRIPAHRSWTRVG